MRKHWIDNLRWVTVLLVLLYHVIYFYNNKNVFGGIGGFGDGPQYQDTLMYILYPWFMPLLFLLAGVSARYALDSHGAKVWFKSRTLKLLVPGTIGLFVFHWTVGYFNTHLSGVDILAPVPQPVKYLIWSAMGTGPLWFIQLLWVLCLVLLLVRAIDAKDKFYNLCGKSNIVVVLLLGIFFWIGEQTLIMNDDLKYESYNLYKPLFYIFPFLMGYFVFSHDTIQEKITKNWIPLMAGAIVSGTALTVTTFGEKITSPFYMSSWLYNLYGWLMCLAMMGWFKAIFDKTNAFADYMTRSSFGFYIVHYLVIAGIGSILYRHTTLPPVAMYLILTVAVFSLSPLLYEGLRRIPVVRWCLFGDRRKK